MIKKTLSVCLSLLLVICLATLTFAADIPEVDNSVLMHDIGGFLTDNQVETLESNLRYLVERYDISIVIATTNDVGNRTSRVYAEDFYEYNNFGIGDDNSGLIFLVDMDTRNIYISTFGKAIRIFTDQNIDYVLDNAFEYIADGDIYGTCLAFANSADEVLFAWDEYVARTGDDEYNVTLPDGQNEGTIYYTEKKDLKSGPSLALSAGIGFAFSLLVALSLYFTHNRSLPGGLAGISYTNPSEQVLTAKSDIFLRTHTTRTKKPENNSSGGGGGGGGISFSGSSSVGRTSSGSSSGGGGRSF